MCDNTELHERDHDRPEIAADSCRFCRVRKIMAKAQHQLKPRQGRQALKVAIGLAVPTIEAWYLVGRHHEVGEAAWRASLPTTQRPFTRSALKKLVYGTDRPSLELETTCAVSEARRIMGDIKRLEDAFPAGFGLMAQAIRSWMPRQPGAGSE